MTVRYLGKITPSVLNMFPQQIGYGKDSGEMYLSQANKRTDGSNIEDIAITHFRDGVPQSTMRGLKGHGYPIFFRVSDEDIVLVKVRHDNGTVKQWVELPYVPNYTWADKNILEYPVDAPKTYLPKQPYWSQGRVVTGGYVYELIGGPWDDNGATMSGYKTTVLNKYLASTGALIRSEDVQGCGRIKGKRTARPERGRVEAEGLALTDIDGVSKLVLNFACGRAWDGYKDLVCYQYTADL